MFGISSIYSYPGRAAGMAKLQYRQYQVYARNVDSILNNIGNKNNSALKPAVPNPFKVDSELQKKLNDGRDAMNDISNNAASLFTSANELRKSVLPEAKGKEIDSKSVDRVTGNVNKLAANFNDIINKVNNTPLFGSVKKQLQRESNILFNNEEYNKIGISKNKDGSIAVDNNKLKEAIRNDTANVNKLLSSDKGLAQNLKNFSLNTIKKTTTDYIDGFLQKNGFENNSNKLEFNKNMTKNERMNFVDAQRLMNQFATSSPYNTASVLSAGSSFNLFV